MQIISSMIYLQRTGLENVAAAEILQTAENRVRSMALVHESLYRTSEFAAIEFRSFLGDLIAALVDDAALLWTVEGEEVRLPLDQAVPCALAVNELIMNALKHAKGTPGETDGYFIEIGSGGGHIAIRVGDRGPGVATLLVAPGGSSPNGGGIGLTLVRALAQQLHGSLAFTDRVGGGAIFTLSFPVPVG
jgi:two-component sensor histidine kinase